MSFVQEEEALMSRHLKEHVERVGDSAHAVTPSLNTPPRVGE